MVGHFEFSALGKMAGVQISDLSFLSNRRRGCSPLMYIVSFLVFAVSSTHGGCEFPSQWAGMWFQNGAQKNLSVNSTFIDTKGECFESQGDKFVLRDRMDGDCYRCIVIHAKHPSVLQYKETFCDHKASLKELCDNISGDAPLFSMFRQEPPPRPQPCPFKGAPFTFSYNRGSGDCITPPSRAESCTDDSRLLLKYQACPDVLSTESNVEELVCLATWREGSIRYLVGKISQLNRRTTDEDSYRCFVYKKIEHRGKTTYEFAQSGDATCNGVTSSTDGSRTIKLTTVDNHHNRCKFPSWITDHHTWHSLNHTRTYHFSTKNATLKISNEDGSGREMRLVCHSILQQSSDNRIQLVAHITQGCLSGHVCMVFHKRDGGVIEVQHPDQRYDTPEDACQYFDHNSTPYTTLITATLHQKPCPHLGRYSVFDSLAEKRKRRQQINLGEEQGATAPAVRECPQGVAYEALAIGCTGSQDTLEFKSSCSVSAYSCHGSWTENGVHYLIASPKSRASMDPRRYCFIYTISGIGNESHLSDYGAGGTKLNRARLTSAAGLRAASAVPTGTMRLSAVSSSCSRAVSPGVQGDRAYNLTINGTCAQSSEYNSGAHCTLSPRPLFVLLLAAWALALTAR